VELLAALVPAGPRYAGRAVYFSDVVVRRERPWSSFAELEGTTWAYNEETSHSGYNATRHRLAQMGRDGGFFGRVMATGSHEASLRLLFHGDVDASAVDSTVLDLLHRQDPSLAGRLRIVESLGPSPSPPWVIARTVPQDLRAAIRDAILAMAGNPRGRAVLASGMASRFAIVADSDYDSIRRMAQEGDRVAL
jgi:phosphonate transport system substrate-binding protein